MTAQKKVIERRLMSLPVIRVDNLGKRYHLGKSHGRMSYRTLRESLAELVKAPFRNRQQTRTREFWALNDVSFEVQPGEVVGIIGRNGAGKSTLLKILSRITKPTRGRVEINGRVGSLLEVGTGFHPELTGRENIYLNGSILGMSSREIDGKFDEIVAFAEVEQFLDTPVKRYSSGMYVRLAFAVAAHLEPEILVVDEVLAVGDVQFQKKCLGKMSDVGKAGRTVLFVSHNMAALQHLCQKAIIMEKGSIIARGEVDEMIKEYLYRQSTQSSTLNEFSNRTGSGEVTFTSFRIEDEDGRPIQIVHTGQNITLVFGYSSKLSTGQKPVNVGFGLHAATGERLVILYASHTGQELDVLKESGEFRCTIPHLPLNPGRLQVIARIEVNGLESDFPQDGVGYLDIVGGDYYGTGRQTTDRSYAPFLLDATWSSAASSVLPGTRQGAADR
jgi:lipopolysaccharide transport system ATP-binding protein